MKKVRLVEVVNDFNKIRVPLSSNQRKLLKKIYPYYGAQGIVDYVEDFLFDGEYLLIAEDGENLKSNNQNICNMVKGKFWVNNHAHILQGKKDNLTRYLYYKLNTINFSPFVTGSSQPKLNKENLFSIEFFIHENIKTQRKIAKTLSDIDDKIEILHQINDNLAELAKTIYDYWFVQFDFPDENGKPYKTSGGKMVYNDILKREIPEGWEVEKLKKYAFIKKGTLITEKQANTNGNIKVVSAGLDFSYYHDKSNFLENTITISASGANAGFINFWREPIFACDCTTVRGNNLTETLYIYQFLKILQDYIYQQAKGSAQPHIYPKDIEDLNIIIPNENKIKKYGEYVNDLNQKILLNLKEIQHLQSLRDWLLPMLMNGQISVE